jgi:eukaryotic-like serine/threonine-protein kinase
LVAVPDVNGLTEPEARRTLADLGFVVVAQDRPSTPELIDKALATEPPAGTRLETGSTVTLLLGSGPVQVPVPDLTGRTVEEAQTLLRHGRLELNPNYRNQEVDDKSQVGRVLAQNPPPGQSVPERTPVEITVGVPQQTVTLINVVGDQYEAAASNLSNQRLKVAREDVDSTEPDGVVVDQDPDAGTEVDVGSTVTLKVSRGNLIEMPDLRGRTAAEAEQILRQLGWTGSAQLVPVPVDDPDQVGTVISHDPPAGQPLRRDQTVNAQIGEQASPPPIFPVPIPPGG